MKPRSLKPGSVIRLVSPSGPIGNLDLGPLTELLNGAGYEVQVSPLARSQWRYLAGTDEERAGELQAAFDDPNVDMVFCIRGGYGCQRLFPFLDLDRMAASRKLFLGFSDITTLHLALNRRGLPTLYGPMAFNYTQNPEAWVGESLLSALRGQPTIPNEAPLGECIVPGLAEGRLVGGCMCLINYSCGTPEQPDMTDALVVIEDVGERAYRVDAFITHLLNCGLLRNAAGFIIGEMSGTNEKEEDPEAYVTWQEVIRERLEPLGKPMVFSFPFGHIKNALTLPLGLRAKLDANAGTLQYLEGLCD